MKHNENLQPNRAFFRDNRRISFNVQNKNLPPKFKTPSNINVK